MSFITDVLLTLGSDDEEQVPLIQDFFVRQGGEVERLGRMDGYAGGGKVMTTVVLGGAFNHFDHQGFIAHLEAIRWQWPAAVTLLFRIEDSDAGMRLVKLRGVPILPPLHGWAKEG